MINFHLEKAITVSLATNPESDALYLEWQRMIILGHLHKAALAGDKISLMLLYDISKAGGGHLPCTMPIFINDTSYLIFDLRLLQGTSSEPTLHETYRKIGLDNHVAPIELQEGLEALAKNQYGEALNLFESAASQGDRYALTLLIAFHLGDIGNEAPVAFKTIARIQMKRASELLIGKSYGLTLEEDRSFFETIYRWSHFAEENDRPDVLFKHYQELGLDLLSRQEKETQILPDDHGDSHSSERTSAIPPSSLSCWTSEQSGRIKPESKTHNQRRKQSRR